MEAHCLPSKFNELRHLILDKSLVHFQSRQAMVEKLIRISNDLSCYPCLVHLGILSHEKRKLLFSTVLSNSPLALICLIKCGLSACMCLLRPT